MPTKWWQWFLVYPTLITSLIASMPTFYTLYRSYVLNVPYSNVAKVEEQRKLWVKNLECIKNDKEAIIATTSTNAIVKVAACEDTGDIIVEINHADGSKIARWVSFEELCKPCIVYNIGFGTAIAMESQGQINIQVICQKWRDNVHLYRRVKVGNKCYDEVVNTYTGEIVVRAEVPCVPCTR